MELFDIRPSTENKMRGLILCSPPVEYEVFGPFGQGYNIRVISKNGSGLLQFHWSWWPRSIATTPQGHYEITDDSGYNDSGKQIIQFYEGKMITESQDVMLLAIFSINHHYWRRTSVFTRSQSPR